MDEIVLVERVNEKAILSNFLEKTYEKNFQMCFVAGNQGDGKTTFIESFIKEVQSNEKYRELHYAMGICDQESKNDGAYEVFKDIFSQLTGVKANEIQNSIEGKYQSSLKNTIHAATETLIDIAPELIGVLTPGVGLLTKAISRYANEVIKNRIEFSKDAKIKEDEILFNTEEYFRNLSKKQPVILVFDDIQWIDKLSLKLLRHLKNELKDTSILMIGAYRPNEIVDEDEISQLIAKAKLEIENAIIDLNIDNFSESKRIGFVTSFLENNYCKVGSDFVSEFANRTSAKPLWLVELLRFLRQDGYLLFKDGRWVESENLSWHSLPLNSTRLEGLLDKRVKELDPELKEILLIACVEGFEFTAQTISEITGKTERFVLNALDEKLDRQYGFVKALNEEVIGNQTISHFRFTNIYYQEYLYESVLGAGERRLLHSQVATTIEKLFESDLKQVTLELSIQYKLAQNIRKTVDYLIELGRQQTLNRQIELAEETLNDAWSLAQACEYHYGAVRAMYYLADGVVMSDPKRWSEAKEILESCIELARRENFSKELSYALTNIGRIYRKEEKLTVAVFHYMESINLAQQTNDLIQEGKNLTNIGVVAAQEDRFDDAKFFYEKRLDLAKKANYPDGIVVSYINLGENARHRKEFKQARIYLQQAQKVLEKDPNQYRECAVLLNFAHVAVDEGEISDAVKYIHASQEIAIKKRFKDRKQAGLLCTAKIMGITDQRDKALRIWWTLNLTKKDRLEKETEKILVECFPGFLDDVKIPESRDALVLDMQCELERLQGEL